MGLLLFFMNLHAVFYDFLLNSHSHQQCIQETLYLPLYLLLLNFLDNSFLTGVRGSCCGSDLHFSGG